MVVQITTTRLRKHGLYRMGLYETVCFMMVNNHTYIFDINEGHAQVISKDLNTKSYMAEAVGFQDPGTVCYHQPVKKKILSVTCAESVNPT